jgi:hypothetical protein
MCLLGVVVEPDALAPNVDSSIRDSKPTVACHTRRNLKARACLALVRRNSSSKQIAKLKISCSEQKSCEQLTSEVNRDDAFSEVNPGERAQYPQLVLIIENVCG